MTTQQQAIDIVNARFGSHANRRALHAKGSWCAGTFVATPEASKLSRARHLTGEEISVRARFSNGGGDPNAPDYAPDVRGLAVSFQFEDGSATDVVCQSVPKFFNDTPDDFLAFIRANTGRGAAWRVPLYLATHPKAVLALPKDAPALRPPPSYAQVRFFGVHAFEWQDADGCSRFVRYTLQPQAGDKRISPGAAKKGGRDYLQTDLAQRLADGTVKFDYEVQIAEPGDTTDDPSAHWPDSRRRVVVGTITFDRMIDDPEVGDEVAVFDPTRMTDGIALSGDPILAYRSKAYDESVQRRLATRPKG